MNIALPKKNSSQLRRVARAPYQDFRQFPANIHGLYDSVAEAYSRDEPKFRDDLISRPLIVELTRLMGHGKEIVDVGCGDGHISRLISPFVEAVVGVDISKSMLDVANGKSKALTNVRYVRANFLNLAPSLPNREFDIAIGVYAFCCVKNLNQLDWAFRSLFQLLRSGGFAIIQIPDETESFAESKSEWIDELPYAAVQIGMPVLRNLRTVDDQWVQVARYHFRQKDYLESLKRAGFKVQDVLAPKASQQQLDLYPSLRHEAEVSTSLIYVLQK